MRKLVKEKMKVLTLPNLLTLFRLGVVFPIIINLNSCQKLLAFIWMLAGVASDFLDGWIARRFNQNSDFGRILDPIVDKLAVLTVLAFLLLSPDYYFPLWYFLVVLLRELLILLGGLLVIRKRKIVMESNRAGKNSAFANGVVVILFIFNVQPLAWIALYAALMLTVYSSIIYLREFLKRIEKEKEKSL